MLDVDADAHLVAIVVGAAHFGFVDTVTLARSIVDPEDLRRPEFVELYRWACAHVDAGTQPTKGETAAVWDVTGAPSVPLGSATAARYVAPIAREVRRAAVERRLVLVADELARATANGAHAHRRRLGADVARLEAELEGLDAIFQVPEPEPCLLFLLPEDWPVPT